MYPVPPPRVAPPTIDVLTTAQLRAKRFSRLVRLLFIGTCACAGWYYRDRIDLAVAQSKAEALWTGIVQSFHDAFPASVAPRMKKGGPPPPVSMPKGGSVSPVGRSQRLPVPDQAPQAATAPVPKAVVIEDDAPLGSLAFTSEAPPPSKDWPHSVGVEGDVAMKLTSADDVTSRYIYHSAHYEFIADTKLEDMALRELGRAFEATYLVNCKLPLAYRPTPEPGQSRFTARLFSNDLAYFDAGAMKGSAGTYSRDQKCILVPLSSLGLKSFHDRVQLDRGGDAQRTLIHEITHQMMNAWLPKLPVWFAEGSAEYVAMADYLHGRFTLNQMNNRLRLYLQRRSYPNHQFTPLPLQALLQMDPASWAGAVAGNGEAAGRNYATAAALTFYFYHLDGDGTGVSQYLREIEKGSAEADARETYLMRGRSPAKLQSDLVDSLKRIGVDALQ